MGKRTIRIPSRRCFAAFDVQRNQCDRKMDLRYNPPKASPSNPFLKTHPLKTYLTKPDPKSDPEKRTCPSLVSKCISSKRTPRIFAPKHIPDQRSRLNLAPKHILSKRIPRNLTLKRYLEKYPHLTLTPKHISPKRTPRIFASKSYPEKRPPPKPYLETHPLKTYPTNLCPKKLSRRASPPNL